MSFNGICLMDKTNIEHPGESNLDHQTSISDYPSGPVPQ